MVSFTRSKQPSNRQEPFVPKPIDMQALAREIASSPESYRAGPQAYAPPSIREVAAPQPPIETFGELPTDEIDEIVKAARAEFEALDKEGQEIKAIYMKHIARVRADYERLRNGMKLSMDTFKILREQCMALDSQPSEKKPKAKENKPPEEPAAEV